MTDRLACVALLGLATCQHRELVSPLDAAAKAQPRRGPHAQGSRDLKSARGTHNNSVPRLVSFNVERVLGVVRLSSAGIHVGKSCVLPLAQTTEAHISDLSLTWVEIL